MCNSENRKPKDVIVLKRIHGLIRHSTDPRVQRAAGITEKEIREREVKEK